MSIESNKGTRTRLGTSGQRERGEREGEGERDLLDVKRHGERDRKNRGQMNERQAFKALGSGRIGRNTRSSLWISDVMSAWTWQDRWQSSE